MSTPRLLFIAIVGLALAAAATGVIGLHIPEAEARAFPLLASSFAVVFAAALVATAVAAVVRRRRRSR